MDLANPATHVTSIGFQILHCYHFGKPKSEAKSQAANGEAPPAPIEVWKRANSRGARSHEFGLFHLFARFLLQCSCELLHGGLLMLLPCLAPLQALPKLILGEMSKTDSWRDVYMRGNPSDQGVQSLDS